MITVVGLQADLFWTTVTGQVGTEMPFLSIATEMWRGADMYGDELVSVFVLFRVPRLRRGALRDK